VLINSSALWQKFCVDNSIDIKKAISITLVYDLNILAFLGLGDNVLFHSRLCRLVRVSYSKIHDSSPVTTLFRKLGSVSSCSKMFRHTCTRRSFCPSFTSLVDFCTDLPHPQIFRNDPPYPLTIHIPLICYHSNSKTAIATHLFSHTLNIFFCSACGWSPTLVIYFHLLSSLFEPHMLLKKTSS